MQRAQHEHMLQAQEAALQAAVMAENPLDAMPMGVVTFCNWGGCVVAAQSLSYAYFSILWPVSCLRFLKSQDRPMTDPLLDSDRL